MVGASSPIVQETVKILPIFGFNHLILKCFCLQQMYNQATQSIIDAYRRFFGLIPTRERLGGRKDAFYEFHVDENSQADQQVLKRLSNSLVKISQMCFRECVDAKYNLFTLQQKSCVEHCVSDYFAGYQQIAAYTSQHLKQ